MLKLPIFSLLLCTATLTAVEPTPAPMQPWLGIQIHEVDESLAYHLGLEHDLGILVTDVAPGSPAADMGLHRFDVIIRVNDAAIYTPRALSAMIQNGKAGDPISVIVRRGAQEVTLTGSIGEQARPPHPLRRSLPESDQDLLRRTLPAEIRERLRGGGGQDADGEWQVLEDPDF